MTPDQWDVVHQFVPAVYPNDGVGGHVVRTAVAQRARGRRSEIFVEWIHPGSDDLCHHVSTLDAHVNHGERTLLVYHAATGSSLPTFLAARPEPLVVQHHNLTPLHMIAPWAPETIPDIALGRRQLQDLAKLAALGIGDSMHNARELELLGFARTAVAPIMLRPELVGAVGEAKPVGHEPTVLFVARIAPNKAHHDLIASFSVLHKTLPNATLRLVGSSSSQSYRAALDRLVDSLDLGGAVVFTGPISDSDLDDEYGRADVFCCLSDHEGFGIPLVEAAHHGVPVVAFDAGAVAETVGNGGIVLRDKSPAVVATALDRVLTDTELRSSLVHAARRRLVDLEPSAAAARFEEAIVMLGHQLSLSGTAS